MSQACIFCDEDSGSREHLWPKWIHERKDFGALRIQRGNAAPIVVPDPEQKVKTVCGKCNNGWMSDLESENIPLIGCMFHGLTVPLTEVQQHSVVAWAVKTTMVIESTKGRNAPNLFYEKSERVNLRVHRTIPNRTRIWIGTISGLHLGAFGTDITILANAQTRIGMGSVATIVVGHFVAQVVTMHINPDFTEKDVTDVQPKPGDWNSRLIKIWPKEPAGVIWPPSVAFTNGGPLGIAYLMDRWRIGGRVTKVTKDGVTKGSEGNFPATGSKKTPNVY